MKRSKAGGQAKVSAVSRAQTYDDIGAFWDTHDLADVRKQTRSVTFDVAMKRRRFLVAVAPGILREVRQHAATRGLAPDGRVACGSRRSSPDSYPL
jgi:hypothetical protein